MTPLPVKLELWAKFLEGEAVHYASPETIALRDIVAYLRGSAGIGDAADAFAAAYQRSADSEETQGKWRAYLEVRSEG